MARGRMLDGRGARDGLPLPRDSCQAAPLLVLALASGSNGLLQSGHLVPAAGPPLDCETYD